MEQAARMSLLFDYYGLLLSEKQQDIFRFYHEENLTLAEIATDMGISRQGVHNALKKAEFALSDYEEKLRLVAKHGEYQAALLSVNRTVQDLLSAEDEAAPAQVRRQLRKISKTIEILDV